MNLDTYTERAQSVLQAAQTMALANSNQVFTAPGPVAEAAERPPQSGAIGRERRCGFKVFDRTAGVAEAIATQFGDPFV